jgi:hypothetical protein
MWRSEKNTTRVLPPSEAAVKTLLLMIYESPRRDLSTFARAATDMKKVTKRSTADLERIGMLLNADDLPPPALFTSQPNYYKSRVVLLWPLCFLALSP